MYTGVMARAVTRLMAEGPRATPCMCRPRGPEAERSAAPAGRDGSRSFRQLRPIPVPEMSVRSTFFLYDVYDTL